VRSAIFIDSERLARTPGRAAGASSRGGLAGWELRVQLYSRRFKPVAVVMAGSSRSGGAGARLHGLVFDMDGTLVDTERVHFRAWNRVFGEFGIDPKPDEWFEQWVGVSAPKLAAAMTDMERSMTISAAELLRRKEAAFMEIARDPHGPVVVGAHVCAAAQSRASQSGLLCARADERLLLPRCPIFQNSVFDGLLSMLENLHRRRARVALCTSSLRQSAEAVLDGTGLGAYIAPAWRTTLDDIEHAKPAPEPYVRAARTLGLTPALCAAVEDSVTPGPPPPPPPPPPRRRPHTPAPLACSALQKRPRTWPAATCL
jgi:beta-phosphoglucomutase-like phosphatase (HAD superfamily)